MQNNIRLCYVSSRVENDSTLLDELNSILMTSRKFNKKHNICGVLYYAEGSFFQCLEGERDIVHHLFFNKIKKDLRHCDLLHFEHALISENKFQNWSMKYVNSHSEVFSFFAQMGCSKFEPKALSENNIDHFLEILFHQKDEKVKPSFGFKSNCAKLYL